MLIEILGLVRQGVPWSVAVEMSPARRLASLVILGEMQGGSFDWANRCWRDQS